MKKLAVIFLALLLVIAVAGCKSDSTKVDAQEAYNKLEAGMSYEEVAEVLSGFKVESDSTAEAEIMPGQKVTHRMIMWRAEKTFIQTTFENGKLIQQQIIKN